MVTIATDISGIYTYYEDLFSAQKKVSIYLIPEHDAYVARLLHEYSECKDLYVVSTSELYLEGHNREAGDRSLILSGLRSTLKSQYNIIGPLAYGRLGKEPYESLAGHFHIISKVLCEVFTDKGNRYEPSPD